MAASPIGVNAGAPPAPVRLTDGTGNSPLVSSFEIAPSSVFLVAEGCKRIVVGDAVKHMWQQHHDDRFTFRPEYTLYDELVHRMPAVGHNRPEKEQTAKLLEELIVDLIKVEQTNPIFGKYIREGLLPMPVGYLSKLIEVHDAEDYWTDVFSYLSAEELCNARLAFKFFNNIIVKRAGKLQRHSMNNKTITIIREERVLRIEINNVFKEDIAESKPETLLDRMKFLQMNGVGLELKQKWSEKLTMGSLQIILDQFVEKGSITPYSLRSLTLGKGLDSIDEQYLLQFINKIGSRLKRLSVQKCGNVPRTWFLSKAPPSLTYYKIHPHAPDYSLTDLTPLSLLNPSRFLEVSFKHCSGLAPEAFAHLIPQFLQHVTAKLSCRLLIHFKKCANLTVDSVFQLLHHALLSSGVVRLLNKTEMSLLHSIATTFSAAEWSIVNAMINRGCGKHNINSMAGNSDRISIWLETKPAELPEKVKIFLVSKDPKQRLIDNYGEPVE